MEKNKEFYNEVYLKGGSKQEYAKEPEQSIYFPVWDKIRTIIAKKERIFEIGCGVGQLANILLKNNKNYLQGIDFSKVAIEKATELNSSYRSEFDVGDIYYFDFSSVFYDTIICCEVLEHIEKDVEIISKLSPNIRFIFSVPNYNSESHLRKFDNKEQIEERYGKLLKFINVYEFSISKKNNNKIFLVDSLVV